MYVWGERRILARFQNRRGPNRWGPFGLLQPIADLLKLITKEDLIPRGADRIAFTLVPLIMVMPLILMLAVIPFARNTYLVDLSIGVLFVVAVGSVSTLGIFTAGWSSGNRFAMFGAMRGVAMLISYEVPVVLALVGVVLIAGSMRMTDVVNAQTVPFILVQPLGLFIFFLGISAELNRTPFDIVEAESELTAGFPYRVQRHQVLAHPDRRVWRRTRGLRSNGHPVSGWLVRALPVRPAGGHLVPSEGGVLRYALHLDKGHLSRDCA